MFDLFTDNGYECYCFFSYSCRFKTSVIFCAIFLKIWILCPRSCILTSLVPLYITLYLKGKGLFVNIHLSGSVWLLHRPHRHNTIIYNDTYSLFGYASLNGLSKTAGWILVMLSPFWQIILASLTLRISFSWAEIEVLHYKTIHSFQKWDWYHFINSLMSIS